MALAVPLCDLGLHNNKEQSVANISVMQRRDIRNQDQVKKEPVEQAEDSNDEDSENEDPTCDNEKKVLVRRSKLVKIVDVKQEQERKVRVRRSKLVKVVNVKQEDSENEDPYILQDSENEDPYILQDNENEDPTYDYEKESQKRKMFKNKKIVADTQGSRIPKVKGTLSPYEQMVIKNREEKLAFLQSLKIDEAKIDLSKAVESIKKRRPTPAKRKFVKKADPDPPILRKSRRLANIGVDLSEDALYMKALKDASEAENVRKSIAPELSFKEALDNEDLYEDYVKNINIKESKSETKFARYDKSDLKNMTVAESNIAKITPSRITALVWYPSPEQLIVAGGDKYGNLGILNVNSQSDPYLMKIHLEGITNLRFSPFNQVQLISSSYDGILRCGDMVQNKFNEIYNVSDTTCCTYFDLLSASTYLVAQKNGQIALVDRRTRGKSSEKKHDCHDYSIKTVSVHPVDTSYFISADNRGSIRLWDLRKLQKNPVADLKYHERCVQSAYFSPVTGNSILATSADDSVSVFDSSNLTSQLNLKKRMKHNNQTGRWLSVFRAAWLPNNEESFVIGSMDYPRRIQVFDDNMFVYNMMDENLTTICSTNAFHPTRHALASGNSSGKIFVFI